MKCILHIDFGTYTVYLHGRFHENLCQPEIWDELLLSDPIEGVFMFENLDGKMGLL